MRSRILWRGPKQGGFVLTSLMAKLRCKSFAERMFVPAFIFFFQMLYPFAWANDPRRATAAAAGGCMLVRRDALQRAGGLAAIRDALIDDCALAKALKRHGPISIALDRARARASAPIRRSATSAAWCRAPPMRSCAIRRCCSLGTVLGLALTYLAPVALAIFAGGVAAIHRHLRLAVDGLRVPADAALLSACRSLWAPALPAIAAMYMAFTLDSAYQHARGRGGMWKGRAQADLSNKSNISELR